VSRAPATWRKRVAKGALLIGALVVGGVVARAYPRDVALRYDLGAGHEALVEVRLSYSGDEGEMAGAAFREPGGMPERLDHEVELSPGHYRVAATLVDGAGSARRVERSFDVPSEGVLRIDLGADR
jgi:hypothetical protein